MIYKVQVDSDIRAKDGPKIMNMSNDSKESKKSKKANDIISPGVSQNKHQVITVQMVVDVASIADAEETCHLDKSKDFITPLYQTLQ